MILTRPTWIDFAGWKTLHQQSWLELRSTVVYDPTQRQAAWAEMVKRSLAVVYGNEGARNRG